MIILESGGVFLVCVADCLTETTKEEKISFICQVQKVQFVVFNHTGSGLMGTQSTLAAGERRTSCSFHDRKQNRNRKTLWQRYPFPSASSTFH